MITIYEIAKLAECAPSTVSKALNDSKEISDEKKELIKNIAKEHKYIPNQHAKSLITKKNYLLGIIYEEELGMGISHHFYSKVIESFRKNAENNGFDVIFIHNSNNNSHEGRKLSYYEHCYSRQVDGLFVPTFFGAADENVVELLLSPIPKIIADKSYKFFDSIDTTIIHSDDYLGAKRASEYLQELNHKIIYHLAGPYQGDHASFSASERLQGYINAMKQNMSIDEEELNAQYVFMANDYSFMSGYEAMHRILEQKNLPTAIFAGSDILALGAYKAIKEKKLRIPEDISVIGYDDIDILEYISPKLTTIRQDKEEIGNIAAKLLIKKINERNPNNVEEINKNEIILPISLIERDSCTPLRQ